MKRNLLKRLIAFKTALLILPSVVANTQYSSIPAPSCYYVKHKTKNHEVHYVRTCHQEESFEKRLDKFLGSLSVEEQTALEKRIREESKIHKNRYGIALFEPTYVLPFYYTGNPYQEVYVGTTPDNQLIQNEEFKAQMSFLVELWRHMFKSPVSLNVSYTQLSYWQVYTKSAWFRETDYEPAIFLSDQFNNSMLGYVGLVHQSNGRGGVLERSWNRVYVDFMVSGENWLISIKPWFLVFKDSSSNLHNPDITRYLGYGRVLFAFKFYQQEISLQFRNTVESGFKRGAIIAAYSFPLLGKLTGYIQFFSGYGQSLIEYNHYTNGVGIGVNINDWI